MKVRNKRTKKATVALRRRWIRNYIIRIIVVSIIVGVFLKVGKSICFALHPVWMSGDLMYDILNYVDDHSFQFGVFFVIVIVFISTLLELSKISKVIGQIMDGVDIIYSGSSEEINLPKGFDEIEIGLRKIQVDTRENEQAAAEAISRKNDMIMYMAHDLKTPLTSIIGYLSLINEEKDISEKTKNKYVGIALKKALRLEELINSFFDMARFNFTHMMLEKSTVNMSMMLTQISFEFEPLFNEKNLSCSLDIQDNVMVNCDTEKMERVYDNLFKNIANYSYPETEISVHLEKYGDQGMRLSTVNHGKTIPPEMLEHVFDQFFRIDSSRNSESGGSGLGLAVTKEIVELHDGTISCRSENEKIEFEIIIP